MEKSSFFNAELVGESYDRTYLAEDFAKYFSSFIGNGVFPNPSTGLQVVADGTSMNVKVKKGKGWINGYFYENTDDLVLTINVADGVLDRIDRVVLRLDFLNREIKAYIKKGTFTSNPVAPVLQRDVDAYELALADIKIDNGVTSIKQEYITDLRFDNNYCGIVSGVVDQIDTSNLFTQFQDGFDNWFENVKSQLGEDIAGNLQNQITEIVDSKGEVNGIASLDENNKIPVQQIPNLEYIPINEKGQANGVATLDQNGHISSFMLNGGVDILYDDDFTGTITIDGINMNKYKSLEILIGYASSAYGTEISYVVNGKSYSPFSNKSYAGQTIKISQKAILCCYNEYDSGNLRFVSYTGLNLTDEISIGVIGNSNKRQIVILGYY